MPTVCLTYPWVKLDGRDGKKAFTSFGLCCGPLSLLASLRYHVLGHHANVLCACGGPGASLAQIMNPFWGEEDLQLYAILSRPPAEM